MHRRSFLNTLAAGGSCAWLVGRKATAQANGAPIQQDYSKPVPFVPDPAQAASYFAVSPAASGEQAAIFPQSVASGDPRPNGVVLWTRVDPQRQLAGNLVAWQISTTADFQGVIINGLAALSNENDNTVKLPVSDAQLQPYTTFFYRFLYNGVASRTGRFKTLPEPNSAPASIKFAFVVCQDFGNGYYTALQFLAAEQVDYVIHLGDYIYETIASPAFQSNAVRTLPPFPSGSGNMVPQDVNDYRHLYKVYRSDQNQQAVHENFAYIQLWDDHEFANDCHQDFRPDDTMNPDAPEPDLRQAANQAWAEYGLADVPFQAAASWDQSVQVYRKFSFGNLADLIVTDERLYRDGPPCGNSQAFQRYFSLGCAELHNPNRTMLGEAQRQWFLDQVTDSNATWKLWANEVMLMPLKVAGRIYVSLDQWDGYPSERTAILEAIENAGVKNLVVLTGDLHTFQAGYLKTDFNNLFQRPMGVEFMVGSITSANLAEEITSALHLPSAPMPAKHFGVPPNLLEPLIRLNNPHIRYWNSSTHGYGIVELSRAQLSCTFKAVTTVRSATANVVRLKTFTVPAGQARIEAS